MYYACLEFKPEKHSQSVKRIMKVKFKTRREARDFISQNFNSEIHSKCWTE